MVIYSGNKDIFVFEEDDIIKGFSIACDCRDDDKKGAYELALLYVENCFRRKGIGNALVREFESIAINNKKDELIVWVMEKNDTAIAFYEKHGYIKDGLTKYMEKIDATGIRMYKKL